MTTIVSNLLNLTTPSSSSTAAVVVTGTETKFQSPSEDHFPNVSKNELRHVMEADMSAICSMIPNCTPEEKKTFKEEYAKKVLQTTDWIDQHSREFFQSVSWKNGNTAKIPKIGFPGRIFSDSKTGDCSLYISLGTLAVGGDKRVKSVVRLTGNKITRLVRATIRKISTDMSPICQEQVQKRREHLYREAQIGATLIQASVWNIVPIRLLRLVTDGNTKYKYFMLRFERTLEHFLKEHRAHGATSGQQFPQEVVLKTLNYLLYAFLGLSTTHNAGWVHRDIKPSNIFIRQERAALADFSATTKVDMLQGWNGTRGYIAPEVLSPTSSQNVSPANDMWSYGIVLYEATHADKAIFGKEEGDIIRILQDHDRELKSLNTWKSNRIFEKKKSELILRTQEKIQPLMKCLQTSIEAFRRRLHVPQNPLLMLISDLIALDPKERPTAQQAFERLKKIYFALSGA